VRRDDRGLPIHGLLAAHPGWSTAPVEVSRAGGQRLRARLDFGASPELMAAFPFAHELELDVTLSPQRLRVRTTVRATGRAPVPVAFGFHPYLRLPGADRREWELSLPSRLELGLDARGIPSGAARRRPAERLALGDRAFDDAFDGIADGAAFTVAGGGRAITVTHEHGYPVAQLFAPAGSPFVCLEPMTAPVDALRSGTGLRRVAPGGAFSACFSIAVRRS